MPTDLTLTITPPAAADTPDAYATRNCGDSHAHTDGHCGYSLTPTATPTATATPIPTATPRCHEHTDSHPGGTLSEFTSSGSGSSSDPYIINDPTGVAAHSIRSYVAGPRARQSVYFRWDVGDSRRGVDDPYRRFADQPRLRPLWPRQPGQRLGRLTTRVTTAMSVSPSMRNPDGYDRHPCSEL